MLLSFYHIRTHTHKIRENNSERISVHWYTRNSNSITSIQNMCRTKRHFNNLPVCNKRERMCIDIVGKWCDRSIPLSFRSAFFSIDFSFHRLEYTHIHHLRLLFTHNFTIFCICVCLSRRVSLSISVCTFSTLLFIITIIEPNFKAATLDQHFVCSSPILVFIKKNRHSAHTATHRNTRDWKHTHTHTVIDRKKPDNQMSFWNVQTLTTAQHQFNPIRIFPFSQRPLCISFDIVWSKKMRRTFDLLSFSSHLISSYFSALWVCDWWIYAFVLLSFVLLPTTVSMYVYVCVCVIGFAIELVMSMCDYVYLIYIKFMCMDA